VELTRRQEAFIHKLLDLYREAEAPVHYADVARALEVRPVTAYEMLRLLEEKGLVTSEYVMPSSGPGRSTIVFRPTEQGEALMRQLAGETWDREEWETVKARILKALQAGSFDVLVGVNLLREGLDLPDVSLVAILDADKEGFLRSETSLVQMIGRTARNVNAQVVLYADRVTRSMQRAMDETNRRRALQIAYNEEHGITPETIRKGVRSGFETVLSAQKIAAQAVRQSTEQLDRREVIETLKKEMLEAAEELDFERAARLRDHIKELEEGDDQGTLSTSAAVVPEPAERKPRNRGRRRRPNL